MGFGMRAQGGRELAQSGNSIKLTAESLEEGGVVMDEQWAG